MHAEIHFKRNGSPLRIGDRDMNALPLVILVIEFLDPAIELNRQSIDAIEYFDESANRIIGDGVFDKIQIEILRGAAGIPGYTPHDNTAFYRSISRHSTICYRFQDYVLPKL